MRWMRRVSNAILMVTLVKPTVRWTVARWRKRVRESAATTIGVPVQELFEAALLAELAAHPVNVESSPREGTAESSSMGAMRTALIGGAVLAVVASLALALVAVIRRRRARDPRATSSGWVAVPVEESIEDIEEAVAQDSLVE